MENGSPGFCHAPIIVHSDWLPSSAGPSQESIVNMGNAVYVKMVIFFPFCSGGRHPRGFQEHTILV